VSDANDQNNPNAQNDPNAQNGRSAESDRRAQAHAYAEEDVLRAHVKDDSPLLLDCTQASLLDLVDNLLSRGVVLDAELVLGLAGVDLVYVRLGALLCAADRVLSGGRVRSGDRVLPGDRPA
jgi:hypothetical protein